MKKLIITINREKSHYQHGNRILQFDISDEINETNVEAYINDTIRKEGWLIGIEDFAYEIQNKD